MRTSAGILPDNRATRRSKSQISLLAACLTTLFVATTTRADLALFFQDNGRISVSVDGHGDNSLTGGVIRVNKPSGGTVRRAFLMAASNFERVINDGDVILAESPVRWSKSVFNGAGPSSPTFFNNVLADVTAIVRPILDGAPAGLNSLPVRELETATIDGTILVVVFNDPAQHTPRGVILLFGGQRTLGDSFLVQLSNPLDLTDPSAFANAGLGISFGFQGRSGTSMVSLINVNGIRLTSSAGGEDDGAGTNGALITVGGIGDSTANPPAFTPSQGFATDDELYDLKPFLNQDDTSILFDTVNPTDDDNILFAYFYTSLPSAILPAIPAPGARSIQTADLAGSIDPTKPTIVLTHGLQDGPYDPSDRQTLWTSFGPNKAGSLIRDQLGSSVNVLQYTWEEAFHGAGALSGDAYIAARRGVADAAANLAKRLFEELGPGYNQPIHFIGHSLGTAVNAYAARSFLSLSPSITQAQFTSLDYPNLVVKIPSINETEGEIYGFDSTFFASVLPMNRAGLALRVDNYFNEPQTCLTCSGVGGPIQGDVYNHTGFVDPSALDDELFSGEGFSNDHSGVQQWYRWTINPNGFGTDYCNRVSPFGPLPQVFEDFHHSLDPCLKGWHWSMNGPKTGNFPEKFPQSNATRISVTELQALALENFTDFGCQIQAIAPPFVAIRCREASSPFGMATVNISPEAKYLSFEYEFTRTGDGDYAAVLLDDVPIWVVAGSSVIEGQPMESGLIPVGGLSGLRNLTIALYGTNVPNAEVEVRNFRTFSVETTPNALPIANAGPDQTGFVGDTITLDGSGSSDPDSAPQPLSFSWTQVEGPTVTLNGASTASPTFVPITPGNYTFRLVVSDGEDSASADVTISVIYNFSGFFLPVDYPPAVNAVEAGRAIPVKFSLNGNQGLDIFAAGYPVSQRMTCSTGALVDGIEATVTAGGSGISYDLLTDQYTYVWKTNKAWAGTCRQFNVRLKDGTDHMANFHFK